MTVREMQQVLAEMDPDAAMVVAAPRTGEDDEEYPWKVVEEVANDPGLLRFDPTDPLSRYAAVGDRGTKKCVTIW